MTIDERQDIEDPAAAADMREERLARRAADLYAGDPQFAAAKPDPAVVEAVRRGAYGSARAEREGPLRPSASTRNTTSPAPRASR
jgi:hypothetical protein